MGSVESIIDHLRELPKPLRRQLERALNPPDANELTDKQKLFVAEYAVSLNVFHAARACGLSPAYCAQMVRPFGRFPHVVEAVRLKLAEREEASELKADYVREYIMSVLELCPTDFFVPAPDGGWMVQQDNFENIPRNVKRLIEEIELREIRGVRYLAIRFISKSASLAMAARYTLVQSINAQISQSVEWDEVAKSIKAESADAADAIEKRIAGELEDKATA